MIEGLPFHSSTEYIYVPLAQKYSGCKTGLTYNVREAMSSFIKNLKRAVL